MLSPGCHFVKKYGRMYANEGSCIPDNLNTLTENPVITEQSYGSLQLGNWTTSKPSRKTIECIFHCDWPSLFLFTHYSVRYFNSLILIWFIKQQLRLCLGLRSQALAILMLLNNTAGKPSIHGQKWPGKGSATQCINPFISRWLLWPRGYQAPLGYR